MPIWAWRRISRFLEDSPLVLASGLALLCVPAIVILAWVFTGRWQSERIDLALARQGQQVQRQLLDAEFDVEIAFSQIKSVTTWVAEEGHSYKAITSPAAVPEANDFLLRIAETFSIDLLYVMDASGVSVASSNAYTPASTVGKDFSDREHFQAAIEGRPGRQFAIGRTTKIPGFFFSMPVKKGDIVVGTVGVKLDQPHLMRQARIPGGLVSDTYGIVVMAENPQHMFKVMPGVDITDVPESLRSSRYARLEFETLDLQPANVPYHPEVMLLNNQPILMASKNLPDEGLTINVLANFDELRDSQKDRRIMLLLSSVAGVVLVWCLWAALIFFLRARDYRRRLEVVNQQLSSLNNELHEQATHDYLTGCLNRRAFSALLSTELDRAQRYGGELSLSMLDLDYFKRVNDSRGHAVGDQVLQFFTEVLRQQMRRSDVLARIGGEEFALLMPNTSVAEAVQVVDRMRQTFAATPVPDQEPELAVTFSAGVAGWRTGLVERDFMSAADQALYEAKGNGRNRVMRATT